MPSPDAPPPQPLSSPPPEPPETAHPSVDSSALRAVAATGLDLAPPTDAAPVSRETEQSRDDGDRAESASLVDADDDFDESPRPVDDDPMKLPSHTGIRPQRPVDEAGGRPAPTPTDILFGPSPAPIGMGAMTAAQIAARATSDELQRRLLETPIAAATERTLLVNEGRTMGREFPLPAETRVFVVANQKGGVGKTTTTVNVAAGLALYGARILVDRPGPAGQRLDRTRHRSLGRHPRCLRGDHRGRVAGRSCSSRAPSTPASRSSRPPSTWPAPRSNWSASWPGRAG